MKRAGVSTSIQIVSIVVAFLIGLGIMYAAAPSIVGANTTTTTVTSTAVSTTTVTGGGGGTTTTSTTTTTTSSSTTQSAGTAPIVVATYGGVWLQSFTSAAKNFTALTGIPVQVTTSGPSTVELPQILAGSSGIDVWLAAPPTTLEVVQGGAAVPLTGLSNLLYLANSSIVTVNGTVYGAGFEQYVMGLIYNSNDVPNPPSTWQQYISMVEANNFTGHVGIMPPNRYQGGTLIQMSLIAGGNEKNNSGGWQLLKTLAPHFNYISTSDGSTTSALTAGDLAVMAPGPVSNAIAAYRAGAPVKFKILTGAPAYTEYDTLVALKGPHQAEALQFINYCLSGNVDTAIASINGVLPLSSQATVSNATLAYVGMSLSQMQSISYIPDWSYIGANIANWSSTWTSQIAPLIP